MPLGQDQQFDTSWKEQDKIRRRQELRDRLKMEGVDKRYSPYRQLKGLMFSDPAMHRYEDFRKRGRLPGAPFSARIFYTYVGMIFIPVFGFKMLFDWETKPYREALATGDIPYKDRLNKS